MRPGTRRPSGPRRFIETSAVSSKFGCPQTAPILMMSLSQGDGKVSVVLKLPNKTEKLPEPEALPPEYSDEALALRFAKKHADDARYVAAWGCWFLWDGGRWVKDDKLQAEAYARDVCHD